MKLTAAHFNLKLIFLDPTKAYKPTRAQVGPDWRPEAIQSSVPFPGPVLPELISFHKEPRMWCSQQDWLMGKQRSVASSWLLYCVMDRGSGSQQSLCAPETENIKLHIQDLVFQECKLIFSHPQMRRCLQFRTCYGASGPFGLSGICFITAETFSIKWIQNHFIKELASL